MKKAMIGYQVYSARDEASKDLLGVLKQLAAMGYDGVEFAGYYGHTPEEVCAMLKETGLTAISSHVPLPETVEAMFDAVSFAKKIGNRFIAIAYLDDAHRPGGPLFGKTLNLIRQFGGICHEAGLQLLYHNHDFEFVTLCGEFGLDFLYDASGCALMTELDTCWVNYAGQNPAEYIRKYAGRCPVVHLKDFVGTRGDKQPYALINADGSDDGANAATAFEFRPVGYGCQDFASILAAGVESGAQWFVVEQDMSPSRPPLEAAKMSRDTLTKLGF